MPPRTRTYVMRPRRDVLIKTACEDAECDAWRNGWQTICDERTPLGAEQADYIRHRSGRTVAEIQGPPTVFVFERGQRCFAEHQTQPARFLITGVGEVAGIREWAGDFGDHMERLTEIRRKG